VPLPVGTAGQRVQCSACGTTWTVAADSLAPRPVEAADELAPGPPLLPTVVRREPCPACGVWIPQDAIRCPACEVELDEYEEGERPWEQPGGPGRLDAEPHRADLILQLGQISVVCVLVGLCLGVLAAVAGLVTGIAAWVMGSRDLARIRAGLMDRRGEARTRQGRAFGIAGTLLNAFGLVACGALVTWYFWQFFAL
jgi:hypothetical protein